MHKPFVGRTTSQSSWHQGWNDRLQDEETPCQYRTGKIEALCHHRDWAPEMPVLEELSCQAAQANAGSRDGQRKAWPGAGGALPCLRGSLQLLRENGQLLLPCYGWGRDCSTPQNNIWSWTALGASGSACLGSGSYYLRAIFSRLTQDMKLNPDWVNISVSLFLWETGPEFKRLLNTLKPPTALSLPPTQAPRNWLIPTVFSAVRRSCSQLGKFPVQPSKSSAHCDSS